MLELAPGKPPIIEGRWQLVATVDDSGTTCVYLAWDNVEQAWRMLRMISFKYAFDSRARGRFAREVATLKRLNHPHILTAHEADVDHALHPYALTEVAEGGSLQDWIDANGLMPPFLVIDVMSQICGALARAHREGVSHGNLRLSEVMVDLRGACKLLGFRGGGEMPEKLIDVRCCGLMLYTLLTGQTWDEHTASKYLKDLPDSLVRAVEQSTQKGRRGGYADVSALSRALEAAVLDLPLPDGGVQRLTDAKCALPTDPMALFDPDVEFFDLVHFARKAADPTYAPSMKELSRAAVKKEPSSARDGLSDAASKFIIEGGGRGEVTYEAPSQGNANDSAWTSWVPPEDVVPFAELEEPPMISASMARQFIWVSLGLAVLSLLGVSASGTKLVAEDRAGADQAAAELVAVIRTEGAVVYALSNAGADRAVLEAGYFAFNDAQNDRTRKIEAARFARTVESQARAHGLDPVSASGLGNEVTRGVGNIQRSYNVYTSYRDQWDRTASSFPAIIPATLGLTSGPVD
ncbi:MAG: protein kinase [Rhodobacterales bacterium]|nr:protein kinase [Rhodobacterales bacterium]